MIKDLFIHPFKQRTVAYYLGLGAAALAVIGAIVYAITDFGDKSFSETAFVVMLVGGLAYAGVMFTEFEFMTLIPSAMYVLGFAFALNAMLPPLSDVWNGVSFIGGNAFVGLAFTIVFAVAAILGIVTAFMELGRKKA